MRADRLQPGDTYRHGTGALVEILREREPATDFFGRPGFFKFWAKDVAAGREGYVEFGPDAVVGGHDD